MQPLIVANWKMNTRLSEALVLTNGIKAGLTSIRDVEVVLCPPFPWLPVLAETLATHRLSHLSLGAQNIFWQEQGAYTGEVSASMIEGLAHYVIIGHSERRRHFHETDREICQKVKLAIAHKLKPILCVGELKKPSSELREQPGHVTASHLRQPLQELNEVTEGLSRHELEQIIVAYEPVWAISTSSAAAEPASPAYANRVAELLREHLPAETPILYGGSVNADNAHHYLVQSEINGLLVGGASLKVQEFLAICRAA